MDTRFQKQFSQAKRIKILLKKYNKTFGAYEDLANFNEPILFLMRRNRRVEFHEKATEGKFRFLHTDGKERGIDLNPQFLHTFDYGRKNFKGYICHEDFPTPLPEDPLVTSELFSILVDKTLNDMRKWKTEEAKAIGGMWFKIIGGIAILILAFALMKLLVPDFNLTGLWSGGGRQAVQTTNQAGELVIQNVTQFP